MIPMLATCSANTDHLHEVAELLAIGLQRLIRRQSRGELRVIGESSLHLSPDQSSDAAPCSAEVPNA
jgi:hypothetical protein